MKLKEALTGTKPKINKVLTPQPKGLYMMRYNTNMR